MIIVFVGIVAVILIWRGRMVYEYGRSWTEAVVS